MRIEPARVSRGLLLLRLGLVVPFLFLAADSACIVSLKLALAGTLLLLAVPPALLWWRHPEAWADRRNLAGVAFWDLLLITLLNVLAVAFHGPPLFFPLYILLTVEATCWWGWGGALLSRIYVPRTVFAVSALGTGLVNLTLALIPLGL
ncbi:MAG: hypothetical protein ACP5SI_10670, partial [Chloroflexia bacterium]